MADPFLARVLMPPVYGWTRDGALSKPTTREILRAWRTRVNLFASRKAWLQVSNWFWTLCLVPFAVVFLTRYFSWPLMALGFLYSMVWLGTHGTMWLHRYSTHQAFTFRNAFYRAVCRELSIKIVPEETYVVSHHVHHGMSEQPGDPYNVHGGWLYCFLAAELHQPIRRDLSAADYERVCRLLRHTGTRVNSYEQYLRWGSATHPLRMSLHFALNWAAWYGALYLLGGHALATAIFGWSLVWAVGIRAHNYDLHAGGKDRRREGVDFDRRSLAVNALWPGLVAGEWHNNHHLFPSSVRSGFLPWQVDNAFIFIRLLKLVGGVATWRDSKATFYASHYQPYLERKRAASLGPAHDEAASLSPAHDDATS